MKRALCVILIISMLLSMLAGCSDGDSAKHDDTTAIDILNIDTTSPDRTGLYDLYWIPMPAGTPYVEHNEIEYTADIEGETTETLGDAFITYSGELVVPFYHWTEPVKFMGTNARTGKHNYLPAPLKLLTISLTDFAYDILPLEFDEGEFTVLAGVNANRPNLTNITPTYDGGYFGVLYDTGAKIFYFVRFDSEGKKVQKTDISAIIRSSGSNNVLPGINAETPVEEIYYKLINFEFLCDKDNNLYVCGTRDGGGINEVCVYSPEFAYLYTLEIPDEIPAAERYRQYMLNADGDAGMNYYHQMGNSPRNCFSLLDNTAKALGEPILLPATATSATQLAPGFDTYQVTNMGIQAHRADAEAVSLVSWVDYNLSYDDIHSVKVISANQIFIIAADADTGNLKLGLFSADNIAGAEADYSGADKKTLSLAYFAGESANTVKTIEAYVTAFNKNNPDYRVKLLAYSEIGNQSPEDMLVSDILSGNIPDMILFDEDMDYRKFDNLNLFCDIYDFMDKDDTYSRDAFFDCVKKPFENAEGELPYLTIQFSISTLAASKDAVGKMERWNLSEMIEFANSLDADQYLIDVSHLNTDTGAQMTLLKQLLPNIIGQYVDYEAGTFTFGDGLAKLLEFCKTVNIHSSYNGVMPTMYMDETVQLYRIKNVDQIQLYLWAEYGFLANEDVVYIGYPSESGSGTVMSPTAGIAVTTKSEHPDGAWEFITSCLDYQREEWVYNVTPQQKKDFYQRQFPTGFSSVIANVEEMCETLSHFFFMISLKPSSDPEKLSRFSSVGGIHFNEGEKFEDRWVNPNPEEMLYSLTDADAKTFMELLHSITMVRSFDTDLLDIIYEDASYYFNGTKSLEETVRIIENRVGIKLAE